MLARQYKLLLLVVVGTFVLGGVPQLTPPCSVRTELWINQAELYFT